jgi:hypothetical protein
LSQKIQTKSQQQSPFNSIQLNSHIFHSTDTTNAPQKTTLSMCPEPETNGQNGHSSQNGHSHKAANANRSNPYAPVGDFLSNVSRFKIIESTLREGEQFANAFFDTGKFTFQSIYHNLLLTI